MSVKNIVKAIPLTSINSTTFFGAYLPINPTGLPQACFLIRIYNNSGVDVTISYDGSTDNDIIPHGTSEQLNFQTNSQPNNQVALLAKGTIVYVRGTVSTGLVYLAGYYQPIQN